MENFKNAEDYVKPGMKVKLRKDLVADQRYGSDAWVVGMRKPGSKVVVDCIHKTSSLYNKDRFYIRGDFFNYTVDMLENPVKLSDTKSGDFKVGDKVRIRKDLKVYKQYGGLTYLESMLKPGTETTVCKVSIGSGNVKLASDKSLYTYSTAMLEHVEEKQDNLEKSSETLDERTEIESRLRVGDVVKIREDIKGDRMYGGFYYREDMIAGGRTAKITSIQVPFGIKPLYILDKDRKKPRYYTVEMFDLDYIRTRNPKFADLNQCSDKSEEKPESVLVVHVGDLVRLRSDLKEDERYGVETFTGSMLKNSGRIVEVSDVFEFGGFETVFTITGDPEKFHYTPEMVKEIVSLGQCLKVDAGEKEKLDSKLDSLDNLVSIVKKGSLSVGEVREVLAKMIEREAQGRSDSIRKSSLALQSLGLQGINREDANRIIADYLYSQEQIGYFEKRLSMLKELDCTLND